MAYVVATQAGRFEVRESKATEKGPRSRTLASFRELTDEVIAKVRATAEKPPSVEELKKAALKAGAPIQSSELDEATKRTLRGIASGDQPRPMLRRLLLDALLTENSPERRSGPAGLVSDAARSAGEWIGAPPEERAKALRDLLELADALPIRPRARKIHFPRLKSV
jgi:Tfp pilus assembly protein FimV